ncbi:6-phosphogluconolactonase [Thiomicrorhabdus sediminis]|uniref:6-phosphogluconolactonase n=1 Tax=Thiomicrorhabdus sediminis TaxID=2580412 RepID=A0A4P9K992_9GAMM|nr:6-phosphogluconolactonase [Thiomicrorhabdus sediminis]QCU91006.1 6-phosphogluconolactonase [Thiomicrorhabdus sediminis]
MSESNLNPYLPDNAKVFADSRQLAEQLVAEIVEIANQAIEEKSAFHFITAGGTTPNLCYQLLSALPQSATDWSKWQIYMGDERVLPLADPERNSQALLVHWLQGSLIPEQNRHFIEVEQGAETAAYAYACKIFSVDEFDLALVGMGEDGHTASLFPGHNESDLVTPINCTPADAKGFNCAPIIIDKHSPKPPAERVSLNYISFSKSRLLIKLVTGAGKNHALKQWLVDKQPLPIALLKGRQNKLYVDQAAVS